ncbi:MAG: hypothetical protein ABIK07_13225 [Planctomycetota bacterium]
MRFWDIGVFLDCMDEPIASRLAESKESGAPLSEWQHDFGFGGMGIEESNVDLPVPQMPYDALCHTAQRKSSKICPILGMGLKILMKARI